MCYIACKVLTKVRLSYNLRTYERIANSGTFTTNTLNSDRISWVDLQ
jgi:hypothetical protein